MHLPSATASNANTNFGGTLYLLCLLGGIIADCFLGRYLAIILFTAISALGTCLLAITTTLPQLRPPPCNPTSTNGCQEANSLQMGVFYLALYLYALGLGGVKAGVSAFGADQFDNLNSNEKQQMEDFFNRFFIFINIGGLLAVTFLVYVLQHVGQDWGYGSCSALFVVALLVFLTGTRRFRYQERQGNAIVQIIQVLVAAIRKRNIAFPSSACFLCEDASKELRLPHTHKFCLLDKAAIITEKDRVIGKQGITPNPWRLCTVTRVLEVKMLSGLMPIWLTTIMFWTVYAQTTGFSVLQASTMNRSLGKNFQIPPGSYTASMVGSLIISLAIYEKLIMPIFRKSRKPQGIGLFFSIVAMVVAALIEARRLMVAKTMEGTVVAVPMSAFWLLPQFVIVGIGMAFISSGQLDFFIIESPKWMKAIGNGLFLSTTSLGMFMSTILVEIVKRVTGGRGGINWLPCQINNGRLDYFYWLLGVLCSINMGLFLVCAKKYKVTMGEDKEIIDGKTNGKVHSQEDIA